MNTHGLRGAVRPPLALVSDDSGFLRNPGSSVLTGGVTVPRVTDGARAQSPPVIAVDDATPLLALPGLLAAAQASTIAVSPATCLAATMAPVELTPADQLLPRLSDPGLAKIVVSAEPPGYSSPHPFR